MNTLETHRDRLEKEIIQAKERIAAVRDSSLPDLNLLKQLNDTLERNMQLISMIDAHVQTGHQPMWRHK